MAKLVKGLQFLPARVTAAALGALGANAAIQLDSQYGTGMAAPFLVKKLRTQLYLQTAGSASDDWIIGFANGQATTSEIATALTQAINDPYDPTAMQQAALTHVIFWETVRLIRNNASGNLNDTQYTIDVSMGGGKGLPILEESGIQLFAYNAKTSSLTTGTTVTGIYQLIGIWMGD